MSLAWSACKKSVAVIYDTSWERDISVSLQGWLPCLCWSWFWRVDCMPRFMCKYEIYYTGSRWGYLPDLAGNSSVMLCYRSSHLRISKCWTFCSSSWLLLLDLPKYNLWLRIGTPCAIESIILWRKMTAFVWTCQGRHFFQFSDAIFAETWHLLLLFTWLQPQQSSRLPKFEIDLPPVAKQSKAEKNAAAAAGGSPADKLRLLERDVTLAVL